MKETNNTEYGLLVYNLNQAITIEMNHMEETKLKKLNQIRQTLSGLAID